MHSFSCFQELSKVLGAKPTVVTMGNFDGCHQGHRLLLERTRESARKLQIPSIVLTFYPHPSEVFQSKQDFPYLFSPYQRKLAFSQAGMEYELVMAFNQEFAAMSKQAFLSQVLNRALHVQTIHVGANFRFGHRRQGTSKDLLDFSKSIGGQTHILEDVVVENQAVSSSRIRLLLNQPETFLEARNCLGHDYQLTGVIEKGNQIGRKIGIPTANLGRIAQLIPATGVYCGRVKIFKDDSFQPFSIWGSLTESHPAVFNIGMRPTLDQTSQVRAEAHILGCEFGPNELYGKAVVFQLSHKLREERKFKDLQLLKSQIEKDISQAIDLLG